jgi:lipopolysaccharide/colanic/teichoic acid biosynthesis glycosyltransferase
MYMAQIDLREAISEALPVVISETSFRATVIRERKRMERCNLAMILLIIELKNNKTPNSSAVWDDLSRALSAIKSDIDILGWFEHRTTLGLIVPDIDPSMLTPWCEQLEIRVRKELTERFDDDSLSRLSVRLRVSPEPMRATEQQYESVDPFLYPDLHSSRVGMVNYDMIKRCLDITGSLTLLILLSPLLLFIASLVKVTSRGPVLFRQIRIGQMMKPFMICKFRSMYVGSDHGIHHNYVSWFINSSSKTQELSKNKVFKLINDPRITPIGQWLRKTSLDELPQLWNVLVGEMSLVGPRPPLWYELRQYQPWHRHRVLEAKPGVSGLWQVSGRSRTTFDEMVRLDLRYARTRSLWTDVKILLATPMAVISGKGAC